MKTTKVSPVRAAKMASEHARTLRGIAPSSGATTLRPWQPESFLSLWERVIEQCHPNSRTKMEAEREQNWLGLPEGERTKALARATLSSLSRSVNTDDEEGRGDDLKMDMANLFQELKA